MSDQVIPNLVSRKEWGAMPPKRALEPLENMPLKFVHIFRDSDTENCTTKEDCIRIIRELQKKHMTEDRRDDIQFNFVIGEDGNVYEGRGWDWKPARDKHFYVAEYNYIEIMLLANHKLKLQNHPIFELAWEVINCGIQKGIVQKEFEVMWDI